MLRKIGFLLLVMGLILAAVMSSAYPSARAQGGANAWTSYEINMRTGPDTSYPVVTTLNAEVGLILEGRNADTSWVLGRTENGTFRGWLASLYLRYQPGFTPVNLPVSNEIVGEAPVAPAEAEAPNAEAPPPPAPAPGGVTAYTNYELNIRRGPGTSHNVVGSVAAGTGLILEGRNNDASWVLAHTEDGSMRGWLSSLYLRFVGTTAASLPYSNEVIASLSANVPGSPTSPDTDVNYNGIPMGGYDPGKVAGINLEDYPIVGQSTGRARAIFLEGREMGRDPHVVSKVGDCSSEHWFFLKPFSWGQYNLGSHPELQAVIDWFGPSFGYEGEATHNGYNVNTVQHSEYANPHVCQPGESPLLCEYRVSNPSVAIIMFGTSDLLVMTPNEFDFFLRHILADTIDQGVVPILSTFPGNKGFWDRTILYNQIVIQLALEHDLPVMNLWLALEDLPNKGLEPDGFHLGVPLDEPGNLAGPNLQTGYVMRNLVTLQTLDAVWRHAMR